MTASGSRQVCQDKSHSDTELLRSIRKDLCIIYKDVLKKPLPGDIKALVSRLDASEYEGFGQAGRRVFLEAV
jgi:hypothetical protein